MRCLGHRPAGFQLSQGCLAGPIFPPLQQLLLCEDKPQHMSTATAPPCVPAFVTTAVSSSLPIMSLGPLEVSEIPNFQSSFSIFSICWGFYNGSWPEGIQHLPHTDIGPFPVLGISVLCWSNSDSNFKIFSAAMSWQDSKSFPMPWLIRGG